MFAIEAQRSPHPGSRLTAAADADERRQRLRRTVQRMTVSLALLELQWTSMCTTWEDEARLQKWLARLGPAPPKPTRSLRVMLERSERAVAAVRLDEKTLALQVSREVEYGSEWRARAEAARRAGMKEHADEATERARMHDALASELETELRLQVEAREKLDRSLSQLRANVSSRLRKA